ncbi:response regulator transcription factor [Colwellia sp. 4_MG-2023]|jgi:two-component system NarL family response regulator|uniref:response regulator transcription factor n=1 Tax=unclassified Colwellia TaxID=196834 RepID=UPI001C0A59E1|nr:MULTISPECIES: response regulator transcription factor [unclassified Colwellia]MBU2925908.1 response regulator transcription factor [Colwellia sp. C2M11]MDO6488520.1 response regulator transcription factor [Colwellia sp. 6_MG-2023]MDO6507393.1 response regulator transcription factor [Colwellia sp. 5_MG-2023]MDO6556187.1 response regulator transcription factor [Colwellia sp. 4_MG-2023]MDO6652694.1 response regulator transcription factor [Colwellia sp. 3_MG-2023]
MIDNNNKSKISVMLVDDHPMVQGGLTACLAFYDDIEIVGATDDGAEALSKAKELKPDVIIMDVSMPKMNGIDATEIISEQLPETRVLIFSMHDRPEFVRSAIDAGASGYVLKDTSSEEVYFAIKAVAKGNTHFSSSISKMLIENPMQADNERLTTREQVILSHVASGLSSKEVARKLDISFRTVDAHRRNIKTKLKVETLAELVRYAVNHGLIEKNK